MNEALGKLAHEAGLSEPRGDTLRYAFAYACANRVRHLLEQPRAIACLDVLRDFVEGRTSLPHLEAAALEAAQVANQHQGSPSIDGTDHAAVSATFTVAKAVAGQALEAASYAAYAIVYAYGRYAVNDPSAFEPEFAWQVQTLRELAMQPRYPAPATRPAAPPSTPR